MDGFIAVLISTILISVISLVGVFSISLNHKKLKKIIYSFVALSAGALLGGAFLHLLPEAINSFGDVTLLYALMGFTFFFLIEKILHWRHCHEVDCKIHTFAYMSLFGDAIHNLIDGLIIGGSFAIGSHLGIISTIAIALHEIPQELGDFAVLVHGGFSVKKALLSNFLIALTAVLGGIIGYFMSNFIQDSMMYLLPLAAGGFLYISASDLLPELRKETRLKKVIWNFIIFLVGIGLMYSLKFLEFAH